MGPGLELWRCAITACALAAVLALVPRPARAGSRPIGTDSPSRCRARAAEREPGCVPLATWVALTLGSQSSVKLPRFLSSPLAHRGRVGVQNCGTATLDHIATTGFECSVRVADVNTRAVIRPEAPFGMGTGANPLVPSGYAFDALLEWRYVPVSPLAVSGLLHYRSREHAPFGAELFGGGELEWMPLRPLGIGIAFEARHRGDGLTTSPEAFVSLKRLSRDEEMRLLVCRRRTEPAPPTTLVGGCFWFQI